ncbi:Sec-independent protein translocase TatB, partial [Escherichia coli]|nr:Sec-independent protein translocase TatB [Escherichia coli]
GFTTGSGVVKPAADAEPKTAAPSPSSSDKP